ncbi:MAG: NAD(P)H-hydrate dehydratase, partial [Clostridia bacterium]|nr:NAD(P)H-hydrate dehydratase [Clostridia bacterium]
AGRVTYLGCDSLRGELLSRFPEAIYVKHCEDTEAAVRLSRESSATLIGSGSDTSEKTAELACALLSSEGSPLILDADAINSIALYGGAERIKDSPRTVILTLHPLEFSRLSGLSVGEIQDNRISAATKYARENSCILLLKGAATVITDGEHLYINGSGSSALAKAGSGDVLAGLLVSLLSYSKSPIEATALAAYIHGRAGDNLAGVYSSYGVTPSDLPREICRILLELERPKI